MTAGSGQLRNPGENHFHHCATPVTRVMYGDLVHEVNKTVIFPKALRTVECALGDAGMHARPPLLVGAGLLA